MPAFGTATLTVVKHFPCTEATPRNEDASMAPTHTTYDELRKLNRDEHHRKTLTRGAPPPAITPSSDGYYPSGAGMETRETREPRREQVQPEISECPPRIWPALASYFNLYKIIV